MKTSRNTNGGGRPGGNGKGNGREQHNTKGKYFYPKYLQEKLAITVLVITLALFALIMVLYRIIRDNNEQYNKIVLTHPDVNRPALQLTGFFDHFDRERVQIIGYVEEAYINTMDREQKRRELNCQKQGNNIGGQP